MSTISERIKKIRKEVKLTRASFGEKIGVSQDVVNNIERGRNKNGVPDNIIKLIVLTFNVNEEWLRTGNGEMFIENNNFLLLKILSEYNLTSFQKKMVEKFLQLDDIRRKAISDYIESLIEKPKTGQLGKIQIKEKKTANSQIFQTTFADPISLEDESDCCDDKFNFPPEYSNMSVEELQKVANEKYAQADMVANLIEKRLEEESPTLGENVNYLKNA